MSNSKSRKLIALILAALMAGSTFSVVAHADEGETETVVEQEQEKENDSGMSLADIQSILSTPSYDAYLKQEIYKDATDAKSSFKVDLGNIVIDEDPTKKEFTTAEYELLENYEGKDGTSIKVGESGKVTFKVEVPEAGYYTLKLDYYPTSDRATSIERTLYINDKVPYKEARYLLMKKAWVNEYTEQEDGSLRFRTDSNGNEIRPKMQVDKKWQEFVFTDSNGFYLDPLKIYLNEGENTVAFEAVREGAILSDIEFVPAGEVKTYADLMAEYEKKGYEDVSTEASIYIDAELPSDVSDYSLYPLASTSSSTMHPVSASASLLNYISSTTVGDWIEYTFTVEEAGLYSIGAKFIQDGLEGSFVSRKVYIDGEIPADAFANVKFAYGKDWQAKYLDGEDETPLKVYLSEGEHTIRFEATLGEMAEQLRLMSEVKSSANEDYLEILRLTGASPDEYRDYGFFRVMPDTVKDLVDQGKKLDSIIDYMIEMNGKSDYTTLLSDIADLMIRMGSDEDQIAKNLEKLKSELGSLGTTVTSLTASPLAMDYIIIQSAEEDMPKAEAGFFASIGFEVQKFFYSFFIDYDALQSVDVEGAEEKESVEVWTSAGREKTQIIKDLVDSKFTPEYGINITIKLVDGGAMLPSVLAGIGPDVALEGMTATSGVTSTSAGSIVDYAIRGAILELQDLEGFEEVKTRFNPTAFEPVSLYGKTYGIPVTMDWPMMFYRSDILSSLNLEIPETWDDMLASVPVLQFNNMDVGVGSDVASFSNFIYQNGGQFWADDGMRINFDANTSLEAFETMMNMFTQYSLPLTYDAANRFRTGEIPLFVSSYSTYNQVVIFASEIAGLWGFTRIPGTLQDDGTVDHTCTGSSDAIIMLRGCEAVDEAWEFMKWYTGEECQIAYSNELVTILGQAGKNSPANLAVFDQLSWTDTEAKALKEAANDVVCLPQFPGSYIISRNVTFAVNNTYNEGADPVDQILSYINDINKEISRKRAEFGFETLEVGQTLSTKRQDQAQEIVNGLSDEAKEKHKAALDELMKVLELVEEDDTKIEKLRQSADKLLSADAELFTEAAGYLKDAAAALESYR